MNEFELIERYFKFSPSINKKNSKQIITGIGDDCAIIEVKANHQLVTSTDTLISGVHFFSDTQADDIAYKSLAVNVSDLSAMGAKPLAFTLALSLPEIDQEWLLKFSQELSKTAQLFGIHLIGGDTTQGPLSITVTAFGQIKKGRALLRSGARIDDDIWVTGDLGRGRSALKLHALDTTNLNAYQQQIWSHLLRPIIPMRFACKLSKYANSAIDISDGLLADLGHIIVRSNVGANICVEMLPLSEALIEMEGIEQARQYALAGGDDYQLCFTANKSVRQELSELSEKTKTPICRIGTISGSGLKVLLEDEPYSITENSWKHFQKSESIQT